MKKKKGVVFILTVLLLLSFAGCYDPRRYEGNHPELYVVAIHSLLGTRGGWGHDTLILEKDEFGRVMFAYVGTTLTSDQFGRENIIAILITQRTTRRHSYFYSGFNFILQEMELEDRLWAPPARNVLFDEELVMEHFTAEQIDQLKMENSWDEPLDTDSLFRVRISRRCKNYFITSVSEETQQEVYLSVVDVDQFVANRDSIPLTMDKNGNILFFMRGRYRDREAQVWVYYPAFLFMFDANGNLIEDTGVMELTDLWDYRDQLREFKEANEWSFYYR